MTTTTNTTKITKENPIDLAAVVQKIHADNEGAFQRFATRDDRFNLPGFKEALAMLNMSFPSDEMSLLMDHLDQNHDVGITRSEFHGWFDPAFSTIALWKAFHSNDSNKNNFLSKSELSPALKSLGVHGFCEADVTRILGYFTIPDSGISFSLFCQMTSLGSIFMIRIHMAYPGEENAIWHEMVRTINGMFGALILCIFSYLPKPTTLPFTMPNIKLPLVDQPNKTSRDNAYDVFTMILLVLWAGIYGISQRMRRYPRGRYVDCCSLCFALGSMCALLNYLNPFLMIVPCAVSAAVGITLFFIKYY